MQKLLSKILSLQDENKINSFEGVVGCKECYNSPLLQLLNSHLQRHGHEEAKPGWDWGLLMGSCMRNNLMRSSTRSFGENIQEFRTLKDQELGDQWWAFCHEIFFLRHTHTKRFMIFQRFVLWTKCLCPLKFISRSSDNDDGIWRRGLWEALRLDKVLRVGFHDEISVILRRDWALFLPISTMWEHREKTAISRPEREFSPPPDHADSLSSDFQPPEWWEINVYCLSPQSMLFPYSTARAN